MWEHDHWLVFGEPQCRAVGLRLHGGGGPAFFLAPKDQQGPSAAEREALLQWAGRTMEGSEPADALRKAPWFPTASQDPQASDVDERDDDSSGPTTKPARCYASDVIRFPRTWVPFAKPRTSWREESWTAEQVAESGFSTFAASCPCFSVFHGEAFRENEPGKAGILGSGDARMTLSDDRRIVDLVTGARNMTHALGVLDDKHRRVMWLGMNYGPVQALGVAEGRLWFQTWASPLDDGLPQVLVVDLRSNTAQACRLDVGIDSILRLEGTAAGLAVRDRADEGAKSRVVPFQAILAELKAANARTRIKWRDLQDGVAYAAMRVVEKPAFGDGLFHVVRIDPTRAQLWAYASSIEEVDPRTAAEWAKQKDLAVVINAGMYEEDHRTHTGYFRVEAHTNSDRWLSSYKSALIVPRRSHLPPTRLIDLDAEEKPEFTDHDVVVQNLRLIKSPGRNVWAENGRQWSEAAVAMTRGGEILFVFSRTPFSMRDFNAKLLSLRLDVVRAMHVEGGPEASLSIRAGGIDLDFSGSYETGFVENDRNQRQWPLPNVLGVRRAEANR